MITPSTLLSSEEVAQKVDALAERMAPVLAEDAVAVCLLLGGLWFAADLTRALARAGRHLGFDAIWMASYGDSRQSQGSVDILAGPQRSLSGRQVLILDDVFDSGLSLAQAQRIVHGAGAREVLTAVFARKPWPQPRAVTPDFVAWEAPGRFLIGYGMDAAGRHRALPYVGAME